MRGGLWIVLAFVILLRIPFLNQAIQGDDVYYLAAAQHAQIDPAHPNHARLLHRGDWVTMRGHPHPPLNGWVLGGLLALIGDIREVPFHAAYIVFSLIAAAAMWSLARRFSPRPFEATLLFCVTLPFVVNGASLESDLPFLAFWMASIALFVRAVDTTSPSVLIFCAAALALAALAAYQSVVIVPILWLYLWRRRRSWKSAWICALVPVIVLFAWQSFERLTSESLPAAVLAGYFKTYDLQSLANKLRNAVALTAHAGWMVFPALTLAAFGRSPDKWHRPPGLAFWTALLGMMLGALIDIHPLFWISFGAGICLLSAQFSKDAETRFLSGWIILFFTSALVLFFAGSARYLLPLSAPVAILVSRRLALKWLYMGAAVQLAVGLALAVINYQHWSAYREFAKALAPEIAYRRTWINAEWGLRYYLESYGALPIARGQAVQPGEMVVISELANPIPFATGGGVPAPYRSLDVTPSLPLRLIGLGSKSGYSTAMPGLRPFDWTRTPVDRVRVEIVQERKPALSYLPMNTSNSDSQIVSGVYALEENRQRWTGGRAVILLKAPLAPLPCRAVFYVPQQAAGRTVTLAVDGQQVASATYPRAGIHTLTSSAPVEVSGDTVTVSLAVDKTFSVPGDQRELGVILTEIGFR